MTKFILIGIAFLGMNALLHLNNKEGGHIFIAIVLFVMVFLSLALP